MKIAVGKVYHFLHTNLLWCLLVAYLIAGFLPAFGIALREANLLTLQIPGAGPMRITVPLLMLSFLLFNAGLSCRTDQFRRLKSSPIPLLFGVLANLLVPLVFTCAFAVLGGAWHNPEEIQNILVGFAIIASMPIAGSSAAWVADSDGNPALILGLVLLSTLLSPLTTPFVFHLVSMLTYGDYSEDLQEMASAGTGAFLALSVVIPAFLGLLTRRLAGEERIAAISPQLRTANIVNLLLLNYSNASTALPHTIANPDYDFIALVVVAVLVLCGTSFAMGWVLPRFFRIGPTDRVSLMFGLGMNNNGTGLVLASVALTDHPLVMVPILFYNLGQQVIAGVFQRIVTRRAVVA